MDTPLESEAPTRRRRDRIPAGIPIDPQPTPQAATPSAEDVSRRAYELFLERGGTHGADIEDWLRAERELGGRVES